MSLPLLDEHSVIVDAPREVIWAAVEHYADGLTRSGRGLIGFALGPEPRSGFEVARSVEGERLELSGRHRFSRYRLDFALTGQDSAIRVSVISYAVFPGVHGSVYRALLIGTGAHMLAVRRMLRAITRNAR